MKRVDQPMINSFLNELKGASHEQSTGKYITRAQYKVTMSDNGRTRNWTTVWCGWKCVAWQTGTWRSWRSGLGFRIWGDVHIFCLLTVWPMFIFLTYVYLLYFTFVLCSAVFFFFTHCNVNVCHHSVNVNLVFCNQSHTYTSYEVKCITLVITPKPHFTSKCPFEVHYSIANMTNEFDCLIRTQWHND